GGNVRDSNNDDSYIRAGSNWITMQNKRTYPAAVEAGRSGIPDGIVTGWQHLGFVLHLLQDLTSPAHTRNDAHPHGSLIDTVPDPDPLEVSEFRQDILPPACDSNSDAPCPAVSMEGLLFPGETAEQMFIGLQKWTSQRFFSKNTVFKNIERKNDRY